MASNYLKAYQSLGGYPNEIINTKISKVNYLLKLNAQCNSISDLDLKHKAWGLNKLKKNDISNK